MEPERIDIEMGFLFSITTFDVETEIVIFNVMSFIAEVGGFLGLLLGASLYSTFLTGKVVTKGLVKKANTKDKESDKDLLSPS